MACISCGVITRAWLWRNSKRCESAIQACPAGWSDSCLAYTSFAEWSLCDSALRKCAAGRHRQRVLKFWANALHPKFFAEVEAAHVGIIDDLVGRALHQNLARVNDVGTVGQAERFADIMIGNQHADAAVGEVTYEFLNVSDSDRVD